VACSYATRGPQAGLGLFLGLEHGRENLGQKLVGVIVHIRHAGALALLTLTANGLDRVRRPPLDLAREALDLLLKVGELLRTCAFAAVEDGSLVRLQQFNPSGSGALELFCLRLLFSLQIGRFR
jgi:hypothetical protein